MSFKIHIKNYQRLEDLELDLLPGINLISGSSNNGKSSVIRAVRDFIFNKISKDKIRHGEEEVVVEMDTAKATRNSKGTIYEVDGNVFEKVGRNILPEIKEKFNIDEMVINNVSIRPNFWFQMDKPFLSDKTSGQKHDLLVGTKNDKYIKALKKIKSEQMELTKVTKKYLEEVIDALKKNNLDKKVKLKKLEKIEEIVIKINDFEKSSSDFNNLFSEYTNLKKNSVRAKELKEKLIALKEMKYGSVYEMNDRVNDIRGKLNEIYPLYKKNCNSAVIEEYSRKKNEQLEKILQIAGHVNNDLRDKYFSLTKELVELDNKINYWEQAVICEKRTNALLETKKHDFENILKEFDKFKKELGVCPLCGGKL